MKKILLFVLLTVMICNVFAQVKYKAEKVVVAQADTSNDGKFKSVVEKKTLTIFTISKGRIRLYCEECNPYVFDFLILGAAQKDENDSLTILTYRLKELSTRKYYSIMFLFKEEGIGSIGLLNYSGTLLTYFSIKNMTDD